MGRTTILLIIIVLILLLGIISVGVIMRVSAPVTDYIRASTMNTQGDLAVRGAMAPQRLAAGALDTYLKAQGAGVIPIYEALALRDTGVDIAIDSRNAAGNQVITGVGFQASVIILLGVEGGVAHNSFSAGFDDGTTHYCIYQNAARNVYHEKIGRAHV